MLFMLRDHYVPGIEYTRDSAIGNRKKFTSFRDNSHWAYHLEPGVVRVSKVFHYIEQNADETHWSFRLQDITSDF
jgi:hypothetical protein